jgi:hypothetical protein
MRDPSAEVLRAGTNVPCRLEPGNRPAMRLCTMGSISTAPILHRAGDWMTEGATL